MSHNDMFSDLARFYDPIMSHVDYDRWFFVTTTIAQLLQKPINHLDAACGTGRLGKKLHTAGWRSLGSDLSFSMLRMAKTRAPKLPTVQADLRALPYRGSFDYVTCLFDSINFLLDLDSLHLAMKSLHGAIRDGGILYFDIVTERMVMEHFAGQEWTEQNGKITSTWSCKWHPDRALAETSIRINSGVAYTIYEHIHTFDEIDRALENAGFELLGAFDAETWKSPGKRTVRVDYVAVKGSVKPYQKPFRDVRDQVKRLVVR
ncbi:MAG: hypothetical protein AMXMBFR84_16160 [Candidatus Hydrogenedentota bacterium]